MKITKATKRGSRQSITHTLFTCNILFVYMQYVAVRGQIHACTGSSVLHMMSSRARFSEPTVCFVLVDPPGVPYGNSLWCDALIMPHASTGTPRHYDKLCQSSQLSGSDCMVLHSQHRTGSHGPLHETKLSTIQVAITKNTSGHPVPMICGV